MSLLRLTLLVDKQDGRHEEEHALDDKYALQVIECKRILITCRLVTASLFAFTVLLEVPSA